jgi:TFIIF-interacting CTD phosphatase-like protein
MSVFHTKFIENNLYDEIYGKQLQQQNQEDTGLWMDSCFVPMFSDTMLHVHVRPGLFDFLQGVCSKYETHIFTASMAVYANPILDYIEARLNENSTFDQNSTWFAGRWYRQHCTVDNDRRTFLKNLSTLWPQLQYHQKRSVTDSSRLRRTVLVDNNPVSFLPNPENGILVPSFYTNAEDTALPQVWDLLQELENEPDVRPALAEKFALKHSFGSRGLDADAQAA